MRYYDLIISDPKTNKVIRHWTSHPNGISQPPDPGALNIEFDIIVSAMGLPTSTDGCAITIHGVPLSDLAQSQDFYGMNLTLKGGMGKGLPLANPAQVGILLTGSVFQSFGNWAGTDQTLDFIVTGSLFSLDQPGNFSVNWPAGLPLNLGIAQVLNTAFPGVKQNMLIKPGIVFPNHEYGLYSTLRQFATFVQNLTTGYGSDDYPGVFIAMQAGQFFIADSSEQTTSVHLALEDLVGQPTWISQNTMQVQTVLRGDIQIVSTLKMPPGLQNLPGVVTTSASSMPSQSKYKAAFQGNFTVSGAGIRHVGCFTDPTGSQWASIYNCIVQ